MPTLTFKATEMKDAKVAHISLVDRAATRIPFKVIKQEKSMSVLKHLDLSSVFKKEKAVVKSEIIGVITLKSEGFDSVKGQIEEAGFLVSKEAAMEDGSVVFGQTEDMSGEHVLIRLSENAVMAVKSFSPYNMNMSMSDGTSFAEVCKAQGFYPGVGTMVDVLRSGVLTLAEKSEDPAAAAVQVGKMFDEAKQYAMSMVSGLPSKAFKLESIFPEEAEDEAGVVLKKAKMQPVASDAGNGGTSGSQSAQNAAGEKMPAMAGDGGNQGVNGSQTAQGKAADSDMTPNPNGDPLAVTAIHNSGKGGDLAGLNGKKPKKMKKAEGSDSDGDDDSLTEDDVAELVSKQLEVFTAKMEALLGGVSKAVEGVGSNVQALTTRVEAAEVVAKAASEAVSGTVVLGSDGGDPAQVVKSEVRSYGREIDTAYMPRSQRNSAGRR